MKGTLSINGGALKARSRMSWHGGSSGRGSASSWTGETANDPNIIPLSKFPLLFEEKVMTRLVSLAVFVALGLAPSVMFAADDHAVVSPDSLKWAAAPPAFPKGAQMAVLSGDPSKEGLYVFRLKLPAGFKVPAHTHPSDENVTVISGSFHIGMGGKLDETKGEAVKAGGFAHVPTGMQHYAWFTEDSVIQVHGMGPAGLTYVNPADDPRNSK
jgi:quercetin dioxygenase-like cupin family protein